ncbi:phosphogluconate dehydratase [Gammaproteobacteria bacterium]|nr:phosphogluconate dehydratase [Gammaproteobacteria bacterium]MDA8862489.1 phosphogluconate dehydratase [Gammaproteobacteria bacterium]MDA8926134.1 phosphogluconate dehydratase [Gammaproteobacteria bacterium]MDA8997684.1 phosphogluconate dehydratase [Gammaproteobacteria bacterium]MDA9113697.1 phosphogluconate dehydratase [Gammaproteobacteria bacterium]
MNSKIIEIQKRIEERSKTLRSDYLNKINLASEHSKSARKNMGCSNIAHAFASCDKAQQGDAADGADVIGIISAYNDMLSAHAPLKDYPDVIKESSLKRNAIARVAGGVPAMCDGITQGEPGMELSLFSRDVIALSTAVGLSHNVFDAAICLGVCDKIVPGMVIGSLSFGHLPIAFIPAGPMPTGISNADKNVVRKKFANGEVDRSTLISSEQAAYHSSGTCTFYGTANTNQLIMEVMGLQLPSSSFVSPESAERQLIIDRTVQAVLDLKNKGMKTGEMLSSKSWVNGMVGLIASGGSTNLTIHLIAMAESCGFNITLDDMNDLSAIVPTITNVYPNGSADVNEFHAAGGVAAFIGSLLDGGFLFPDVQTLLGNDLSVYRNKIEIKNNELVWNTPSQITDQSIIRDSNNPFNMSGGLKIIEGNIGRGIIKTSSLKSNINHIDGTAIVFDSQDEVLEAFGLGKLDRDCIIVVRGQGPSSNGMPELHKLTSPLNVLQSKGFEVAILTDGRMSGASGSVPAVIHISPEANTGGLIGKIQTDDKIDIDINNGTFNLQVDEKTLNTRELYKVSNNAEGIGRELFKAFRENVKSVDTGASIF